MRVMRHDPLSSIPMRRKLQTGKSKPLSRCRDRISFAVSKKILTTRHNCDALQENLAAIFGWGGNHARATPDVDRIDCGCCHASRVSSEYQRLLHARLIVLPHRIFPPRRAASGTIKRIERQSASAGSCARRTSRRNNRPRRLNQKRRRPRAPLHSNSLRLRQSVFGTVPLHRPARSQLDRHPAWVPECQQRLPARMIV